MAGWGGIIGSALAGGLAGAGNAVANIGANQMKADERQKEMDWQEAKERRMKQLEVTIYEQKRDSDMNAAKAQGAAISGQVEKNLSAPTTPNDEEYGPGDRPSSKAAAGVTDEQRLRERIKVAEQMGDMNAAKEARAALDTERKFQYDKNKGDRDNKRLDAETEWRKSSEERKMKHDEAMLSFYQSRANREDDKAQAAAERELRASTTAGLKNIEKELQTYRKALSDPMADPADKAEAKQAIASLTREQAKYRKALLAAGLDVEGGSNVDPLSFLPKADAPAKPAAAAPAQESAPAPQPAKPDLARQLADIDEKLRDPSIGGKDRLQLERLDILRQMNAGGIINQTKSLSFMGK